MVPPLITSSARAGTSLHSGTSFTGSLLCSGFIDNGRSNCLGNAAGGIAFQHLREEGGVAIDGDRGGPAPAQADDMNALVPSPARPKSRHSTTTVVAQGQPVTTSRLIPKERPGSRDAFQIFQSEA